MHHLAGHRENLEDRGAGLGILAAQDAEQSLALFRRRALIDDVDALALAVMNGAGPAKDAGAFQPVEPGRP
jgi:hypothetical protein